MDFNKTRYIPMSRRRRIYEGKAKVLYEGPEPGTLIQHFKDDATAFNAKKHQVIEGKGVLNNRISEYLFQHLNDIGVPTHFIRRLNMREQLIREVEIVPLEVVVRNVAAGSLSQRLGIEEGTQLPRSIIEFYYKNDQLNDPMVSEEHITAFGWATPQEIDDIMALAIRVNDFLTGLFLGIGIRLVDFKMECGRLFENEMMRIIVADEISPDSCRLWDIKSNEKLDKDRFRRDLGWLARGLHRSGKAARHSDRKRASGRQRPGAGEELSLRAIVKARVTVTLKIGHPRSAGQGDRGRAEIARRRRRRQRSPGQGVRHRARRDRPGQGGGGAEGRRRQAAGEHRDRELSGRGPELTGASQMISAAPALPGRDRTFARSLSLALLDRWDWRCRGPVGGAGAIRDRSGRRLRSSGWRYERRADTHLFHCEQPQCGAGSKVSYRYYTGGNQMTLDQFRDSQNQIVKALEQRSPGQKITLLGVDGDKGGAGPAHVQGAAPDRDVRRCQRVSGQRRAVWCGQGFGQPDQFGA